MSIAPVRYRLILLALMSALMSALVWYGYPIGPAEPPAATAWTVHCWRAHADTPPLCVKAPEAPVKE